MPFLSEPACMIREAILWGAVQPTASTKEGAVLVDRWLSVTFEDSFLQAAGPLRVGAATPR